MDMTRILDIIRRAVDGHLTPDAAADAIHAALTHSDDIGGSFHVDHDRPSRCGQVEVIFGEGKRPDELVRIADELKRRGVMFATRLNDAGMDALADAFGDAVDIDRVSRTALANPPGIDESRGEVVVVCAGTSDLPVAREAVRTLTAFGIRSELIADVGVAGIHRLFGRLDTLRNASALIVVAGMEGALPSVVGGLVSCPVIAVPTHIGYGAAFGGITALLGMLTSCAQGVVVVNIDNGFGAASAAARMLSAGKKDTT